MIRRAPDREAQDDERLSPYPLTFEEALQAALSADTRGHETDKGDDDADRT